MTSNLNTFKNSGNDSETNDLSAKNLLDSEKRKYQFLEEIEDENERRHRKYTIEGLLVMKDFVPQLKPIEVRLVPSKFYLNKKKNEESKIKIKNNFISCPNSENEDFDDYDEYECKEILFSIKNIRKFFKGIRANNNNIPKNLTKNNFPINTKNFEKEDIKLKEDDSSDFSEYLDSSFESNENKIKNKKIFIFKEKDSKNKLIKKENNLISNSFTILDILQNKHLNKGQ